MITLETLTDIGAPWNLIALFASNFPREGTFDEVTRALVAGDQSEWASWLGRDCPAGVEGATKKARKGITK